MTSDDLQELFSQTLQGKYEDQDRIHEAIKVLRRSDEASRKGREASIYSDIRPGDWLKNIEGLEAHDVFLSFHKPPYHVRNLEQLEPRSASNIAS
jgi:hypothetical protein